jgi:zinc protease
MADASLPWHPGLKRAELSNGLKILALQNEFPKDRFYMYLDVNVGSCDEEDHEQGIAHFLEHLVFLGTDKWKTPEEMKELLGGLGMSFGGDTNASTDQKNTVYTMEAPAGVERITLVTEILHQMAFRALLLEECVESERAPILSEKQMRNTISYRRSCKQMELMHGHNILPKRLPIGLGEQIKR